MKAANMAMVGDARQVIPAMLEALDQLVNARHVQRAGSPRQRGLGPPALTDCTIGSFPILDYRLCRRMPGVCIAIPEHEPCVLSP